MGNGFIKHNNTVYVKSPITYNGIVVPPMVLTISNGRIVLLLAFSFILELAKTLASWIQPGHPTLIFVIQYLWSTTACK